MLTRIVKMSFHKENIPVFLENFELMKIKIRSAKGNNFLALYQDKNNEELFFTYSHWETEQDLENYRNSELFDGVWTFTKKLFNAKPEAWSLNLIVELS
jgi:heme-degrading monooxygenase HmoA